MAICLLNSYVNRSHEERLRELTVEVLGQDVPVSISAETSPLAKEYARASTTVIDVMMKLMFSGYAGELDEQLRALGFTGELNFADCAATLIPWRDALERPFRIVVAGPAAGTTSGARLGEALGEGNLICCDVGGTSTDVSLVQDGRPFVNDTLSLEDDLIINALSTEISSVGAGGGSIVSISPAGDVLVGPASAGADPGPACYGRGGTAPTITDACLLVGILDPGRLRGRRDAPRRGAGADRLCLPGHAAVAARPHRLRLPDRRAQHRRGGNERRDPPRRGSARLHAARLRRRRADAAARRARAASRRAGRDPTAPGPVLGPGSAGHGPRLLRQPERVHGADARGGAADCGDLRRHGAQAPRPHVRSTAAA